MTIKRSLGFFAAATLYAASAHAAAPSRCDESCLLEIAGSYMDALSAGDAKGAPVATAIRSTENGIDRQIGEGIWKTATGWSYRHTFVDPLTGGIGIFGVVNEKDDKKAIVAIRLKVAARKVSESEALVVRAGEAGLFSPTETAADPSFTAFVPAERRSTRGELQAIAHKYLVGLTRGSPAEVPFHPDCNRFENGVQTTNGPRATSSCAEGLYRLGYMSSFHNLRFPVVDTERGLVLAVLAFDMPAVPRKLLVRGKPYEITIERQRLPRTLFLYELFKVEGGKIRTIEAKMADMPLAKDMGWPGADK